MKKGIISYTHSNNLGDYIQALAAEEYLGGELMHFDRDSLHQDPGEPYQLLVNGWFMEQPTHWPPHPHFIPLFISFHLNPTAEKDMLTPAGVEYLRRHQPIGCRDYYTQNTLSQKGIETYFSACITLGLSKKKNKEKQAVSKAPILGVSAFDRLQTMGKPLNSKTSGIGHFIKARYNSYRYQKAKTRLDQFLQQTRLPVRYASQIIDDKKLNVEQRFQKAQEQLRAIAGAQLIITSRIHTALPAVALETPVLFLTDGLEHHNQSSRLDGLSQFFCCIDSKGLDKIKWDTLTNPTSHSPYVEKMKQKIQDFFAQTKKETN